MRAGLSTIQQTLTQEASTVLNLSIAEASRRNHGQTTPLHVAATLLAAPSGLLRQACIRSHPNSSHPLQCRALELCFSVALERVPTAAPAEEPPISNALMAALKRAQANQRRGCPEQQQQPLLAVKVELEQLIISILDDPSVSRVMREASFSSPAVKATIEQSLNSPNLQVNQHNQVGGIVPRMVPNGNVYLNPLLNYQRGEEVKKVMEIMVRSKKRNPVLVGDAELESVVKELLRKIENKEVGNYVVLRNAHVIYLEKGYFCDKSQVIGRIKELGGVIEGKIWSGGVVVDLGDLKWLVEQPVGLGGVQVVPEMARVAVVEMAKLLARFGGDGCPEGNKVWLIGTATCETYLRCQVYHSTMENDWDLQAVPIASRSPLPGLFPRLGTERSLGNRVESTTPSKVVPTPLPSLTRLVSNTLEPAQQATFCPECTENYKTELAKLTSIEKSFSESKQEGGTKLSLPQWLQNAKTDTKTTDNSQGKDQGSLFKHKTRELKKKWNDACLHIHPDFHHNNREHKLSVPSLLNPNSLPHPPFLPKLLQKKPLGESLQLNTNQVPSRLPTERVNSPPRSPVQTDLVLGRKGVDSVVEKANEDRARDLLSCLSSEPNAKLLDKLGNVLDADTYKKLLKSLMEKAWWQAEAASAVASAITRCRLGNGKQRGGGSRGDIWLLFMGPDRVGKKKMALVLAEQICGAIAITICLGSRRDEETDLNFRGKTAIDRISEAVRRNPVSVIVLQDIDEADILVRGSIKRAMERGRLTDSHGREVGLGNAVFVLTGDWSSTSPESLRNGYFADEKRLASVASGNWQVGLILRERSTKSRAPWFQGEDRPLKPWKEMGSGLSLDLNLVASTEDNITDGSHNSSNLTIDHEDELHLVNPNFSIASLPHELVNNVDDSILFKPVESAFVRREIKKTISIKFSMVVEDKLSIEIEDDVVEKILGGLWHDHTSLEEWIAKVLAPSFDEFKARLPSGDQSNSVVRLVVESDYRNLGKTMANGDWLPSSILVQGM